jgi:hypothetical protein
MYKLLSAIFYYYDYNPKAFLTYTKIFSIDLPIKKTT